VARTLLDLARLWNDLVIKKVHLEAPAAAVSGQASARDRESPVR
jgi:hypothetical protein